MKRFAAVAAHRRGVCRPRRHAAQFTVFDPSNFVQNSLTAARSLQEINNQLQQLTNEATMLINEARNLTSLPFSIVGAAARHPRHDHQPDPPGAGGGVQPQPGRSAVRPLLPDRLRLQRVRRADARRRLPALDPFAAVAADDDRHAGAGGAEPELGRRRARHAGQPEPGRRSASCRRRRRPTSCWHSTRAS